MDKQTVSQAIKDFIQNLSPEITTEQVVIIGSRAKYPQETNSDIDCLVVSSTFAYMTEDERSKLLYQASKFIEPEIHPWGVTPQELAEADKQSFVGSAREHGISFSLQSL